MVDFEALKRNRGSNLDKLVEAAKKVGGERTSDDRFWTPSKDKAGNGYAVIRFLPGTGTTSTPWVQYWDHAFKGPGGQWYIEKSLSSIGLPDPVSEMNTKLWNSGSEADKQIVRGNGRDVPGRKRNLHYVANIYIVADREHPENEGQVKLFKFGKKIFEKVLSAMQPEFPDEQPLDPFDMWTGADFVLKIRQVDGYSNYDTSTFKSPGMLLNGDEDAMEAVYKKQHDLSEWTDPKHYKTYDELKARLNLVLGESAPRTTKEAVSLDEAAPAPTFKSADNVSLESNDEDDTMSYFAKLAAGED